jgi:transglutaminase-like putative cysteine protease
VKYNITHVTEYFYGEPVPLCHNIVHLKPRDTSRQTLLNHSLQVKPNPIVRSERVDFFGNLVSWFAIQEPHELLRITGKSTVDVKPFDPPTGFWWPAWNEVRAMLEQRREPDLLDARQFVFESPFVTTAPELADYARPSFPPGKSLLECVTEFTQRIFKEFTFDKHMTTIGTPVLEILAHKHGVCQDFAHLQIACLRSLGLAARYVSGYLVTKPPPGKPRLQGTDASHAWVSVYFPDFGWIDFDPTNGILPSSGHITLGWARDYSDISPVKGVVVGGRRHSLRVAVDVEPISAEKRELAAPAQ